MANASINVTRRSVAITGHRTVGDINVAKLEEVFRLLIKRGYDTYLVGMAVGFDTICFNILDKLRETHDIKIIACIPCKDQARYFTPEQKEEYERIVSIADEKRIFSEKFNSYCMHRRNCYMVDNSYVLIAYLNKTFGGTFNTVKYAEKKNKKIVYIKD